ncbi:MAG: helix-turn-helix domain-containing protein [Gammaproteobacteria bacterium]|nr:helix-turn-helix domain-containing protein [Gammaproteobacteria bacterium]
MPTRLRRARTAAKLSQTALADQLRISRSAVAQWEQSAGTSPNIANLSQVAEATEVCFEWLATGRGPMRPEGNEFDVAVCLRDYAHNELETQVLELLRRLPAKKRKAACAMLELLAI